MGGNSIKVVCVCVCMCVCVCVQCTQCLNLVRLFETLWTVAHQAPLSMGFSRQEHWSGLPFYTRGYSQSRNWSQVSYDSCIGRQNLCHWVTWESHVCLYVCVCVCVCVYGWFTFLYSIDKHNIVKLFYNVVIVNCFPIKINLKSRTSLK